MRDKTIFIADGHHRYEVALKFRDEMRKSRGGAPGEYDYAMMYFSDMDPDSLTILAAHRMIKDAGCLSEEEAIVPLKRYFRIETLASKQKLLSWLEASKDLSGQFGLYMKRHSYVIRLKSFRYIGEMDAPGYSRDWKSLDVSILHGLILKKLLEVSDREGNVAYTHDPREAIRGVGGGRYEMAFLLAPTKISQVEAIARNGERMPHKSTYFYPKLLSGLVINKLC